MLRCYEAAPTTSTTKIYRKELRSFKTKEFFHLCEKKKEEIFESIAVTNGIGRGIDKVDVSKIIPTDIQPIA